jgi:poly(hydroxyalkanoate) depolymerase family esterase
MYNGISKGLMRLSRRFTSPKALRRAFDQVSDLVHPITGLKPGGAKPFVPPMPNFKPAPAARPRGPEGADTAGAVREIAAFGSNPGALRMLICVPASVPQAGAPLVVVLHGCGQQAAQFAGETGWLAQAARLGFVVVMPEQVSANNAGRCFNWFRADDIGRDHGEALSIHQMVQTAIAAHTLDPRRVYIVGLSAGGAMAAAMLVAYPDLFAAGASVAGLPVGCALDVSAALKQMSRASNETPRALADKARAIGPRETPAAWPRISIWQGSADHTVDPSNAGQLAAQFACLHGIDGEGTELPPGQGTTGRMWKEHAWGRGNEGIKVELRSIAGMAHGYPIAAGAPTDRFVLPVGVDATETLTRLWGLQPAR